MRFFEKICVKLSMLRGLTGKEVKEVILETMLSLTEESDSLTQGQDETAFSLHSLVMRCGCPWAQGRGASSPQPYQAQAIIWSGYVRAIMYDIQNLIDL